MAQCPKRELGLCRVGEGAVAGGRWGFFFSFYHYVEITGNVKILMCTRYSGTSLVAQTVKNLPAM